MTVSDYLQKKSTKKRKANELQEAGSSRCLFVPNLEECNDDSEGTDEEMEVVRPENSSEFRIYGHWIFCWLLFFYVPIAMEQYHRHLQFRAM